MIAGDQNQDYSASPTRIRRRSPFSRLSAAHLLMVMAAVLAFAVNLLVLRSRDDTTAVVALASPLTAGEVVTDADLRMVEVDVGDEVLAGLIGWEEAVQLRGMVATRSIAAGELATRSAFVDTAAGNGERAMSVPIDSAHAVGGALVVGDRIDLIHVTETGAIYVVVDAEVLSVASADRGALTGSTGFYVVIAVEADDALEVAAAIRDGKIEIVRSTGAKALSPAGIP